MSTPAQPAASAQGKGNPVARVRHFWQRVSEGRRIDDLWSQFAADARASYGFYTRDADWEEIQKLPRRRRVLHIARLLFWAFLLKLTPARRVLLLIACVVVFLPSITSGIGDRTVVQIRFEAIAGILFLLLLSL